MTNDIYDETAVGVPEPTDNDGKIIKQDDSDITDSDTDVLSEQEPIADTEVLMSGEEDGSSVTEQEIGDGVLAHEECEPTQDIATQGAKYIHIGATEDEQYSEIFSKYGFDCKVFSDKSDIYEISRSIRSAQVAVIFESSDVIDGNRGMAYQIREAIECKIDTVIVCKRDYTDFARRFEEEDCVTVIRSGTMPEILHLLFVEKLCKHPELYTESKCERDLYGDVVHHGIDAWQNVAASEKYIASQYLQGEQLPKLAKQAVYWYTRAKEHGSIRAIVSLGNCYFEGNGCPENKKKAYELYCEAAGQNSPDGFLKKGYCELYGEGCETDGASAYKNIKQALHLRHDYPEAEYYLGICLRDGYGDGESSQADAKSHFLKSAKGNYIPAFIALGNYFSSLISDDHNPTLAFEYYSRAASKGSLEGIYRKGVALTSGEGCDKKPDAAYECFALGAEKKHLACLCALGMCYEFGIGCECDFTRAVECYSMAADRGYAAAINNLGGCYYYGHGVERDRKKALELFERASLFGDSNSTVRLGICYEQGEDCKKDIKRAFNYFVKSAGQNNPIGAYKAALCYEQGTGTEQDFRKAFEYFELAAQLGYADAMWHTANYLADGVGTEQDYWKAFKWYSCGAEAGIADCYLQMGHFSFKGIGTGRNYTKAFHCYEKAYELGVDRQDTALRIGVCYMRGLGTKENRASALEWFKRSAALGRADAMFLCGECYFYGSGCQQNYSRAAEYYALAINEGHIRAALSLGICYENGLGVERNLKRALILYRRAGEGGNPEAHYRIAEILYKGKDRSDTARAHIFKAANKNYIPALLLLGVFYDEGVYLPQNSDKAANRYLQAISLGISKQKTLLFSLPERDAERKKHVSDAIVDATYRMGMLKGKYSKTVEEYKQAYEYLAGAAAAGSVKARVEIAKIYASGGDLNSYFSTDVHTEEPDTAAVADAMNKLGDTWYEGKPLLPKNDRAALKCYRISAELGQSDAAYSLGWCLRHGVGTKVDDKEAAKWLKIAADKGNPHAAYSYGLCCEEGSGMEHPNLREAATYYRKAALAGHSDAKKRHLKLVKK